METSNGELVIWDLLNRYIQEHQDNKKDNKKSKLSSSTAGAVGAVAAAAEDKRTECKFCTPIIDFWKPSPAEPTPPTSIWFESVPPPPPPTNNSPVLRDEIASVADDRNAFPTYWQDGQLIRSNAGMPTQEYIRRGLLLPPRNRQYQPLNRLGVSVTTLLPSELAYCTEIDKAREKILKALAKTNSVIQRVKKNNFRMIDAELEFKQREDLASAHPQTCCTPSSSSSSSSSCASYPFHIWIDTREPQLRHFFYGIPYVTIAEMSTGDIALTNANGELIELWERAATSDLAVGVRGLKAQQRERLAKIKTIKSQATIGMFEELHGVQVTERGASMLNLSLFAEQTELVYNLHWRTIGGGILGTILFILCRFLTRLTSVNRRGRLLQTPATTSTSTSTSTASTQSTTPKQLFMTILSSIPGVSRASIEMLTNYYPDLKTFIYELFLKDPGLSRVAREELLVSAFRSEHSAHDDDVLKKRAQLLLHFIGDVKYDQAVLAFTIQNAVTFCAVASVFKSMVTQPKGPPWRPEVLCLIAYLCWLLSQYPQYHQLEI